MSCSSFHDEASAYRYVGESEEKVFVRLADCFFRHVVSGNSRSITLLCCNHLYRMVKIKDASDYFRIKERFCAYLKEKASPFGTWMITSEMEYGPIFYRAQVQLSLPIF